MHVYTYICTCVYGGVRRQSHRLEVWGRSFQRGPGVEPQVGVRRRSSIILLNYVLNICKISLKLYYCQRCAKRSERKKIVKFNKA